MSYVPHSVNESKMQENNHMFHQNTQSIIKNAGCIICTVAIGMCTTATASADIIGIDSFIGEYSESFDTQSGGYQHDLINVFDGQGTVGREGGTGGLIITGGWSFYDVVDQYDGSNFLGSPSSAVEYQFDTLISSFGGQFATNSNVADGTIRFYDAQDALIGSDTINVTDDGLWTWNGWESDTGVQRIVIEGNYSSGGFIMQDGMQADIAIPAPGAMAMLGLAGMVCISRRRSHEG